MISHLKRKHKYVKRTVGAKTHELRAAQCCLPRFILTGDSLREAKKTAFLACAAAALAAAYSIISSRLDAMNLTSMAFGYLPVFGGKLALHCSNHCFHLGEENISESLA